MDELFVYALYKNVLKASTVMEGRFVVLDGSAGDVSVANFGKLVTDALSGLTQAVKYPAVIMLPPANIDSEPRKDNWEIMKNELLFVTLDGRNGDGSMKTVNSALHMTAHTPMLDWKDMKECASNFLAQLDKTLKTNKNVLSRFHLRSGQQIFYRRMSLQGSERLNGIRVSFDTMIYKDCTLADYAPEVVIEIPGFNQHPLHKH